MLNEVLAKASTLEYIGWIFLISVCAIAVLGGVIEFVVYYRKEIGLALARFTSGLELLGDYLKHRNELAEDDFTSVEDWADYQKWVETEVHIPTFSEVFRTIFSKLN